MPWTPRLELTQTTQEAIDIGAAETSDDLLDTLRQLVPCKPRLLEEQEVLYREGEDAESVFVILQGMIKLLVHLPNGKVRIVRPACGRGLARHRGAGQETGL